MLHHRITKEASKDAPRKRVTRACDRCRLKKGKCDGKEQCAKCVSADIMCIYTDRKPPQHKLISPAVAEALQSENLTLKKAAIIVFKQLMEARGGNMPVIEGVDWNSDKVISGKSGRALNYIIAQEARVDNRISNEEIINYDRDTQMLDYSASKNCPDSPSSRQSSPPSVLGDAYWGEIAQQDSNQNRHVGAESPKYGSFADIIPAIHVSSPTGGTFIDPNIFQAPNSINHPPTPPTTLDSLEFLPPSPMDWPTQTPPARYYDKGFLPERCFPGEQEARSQSVDCDNSLTWTPPMEYYQVYGAKEYAKVFPVSASTPIYNRDM